MKLAGIVSAAALVCASTSSPSIAEPSANHDYIQAVQEFCSTIVGVGQFATLSWGECMSFNVVSEQGFRAHFCDALREGGLGTLEDYGFDSYSDCIRNL